MCVLIGRLRRINATVFSRNSFNRLPFAAIIMILCYFLVMDAKLYSRIRNEAVRPISVKRSIDGNLKSSDGNLKSSDGNYKSNLPCDLDPLCAITVKGLMVDYPNYYILGPFAALVDRIVGISDWSWITPNVISFSHVFVAIASAKCISMDLLVQRRIGVILFQLRSWMDDLDGLVARKRSNIIGEHSSIGTSGYIVDGVCDALGIIAVLTGLFQYIRWKYGIHSYEKLQPILPNDAKNLVVTKKIRVQTIAWSILLVAGSLALSSLAWNRYVYLYQELLENDFPIDSTEQSFEDLHSRQTEIFRSNLFWLITISWRLINPHALMDYLLIAIFFDCSWKYLKNTRCLVYGIIIVIGYFTEFYYHQALLYVNGVSATTDLFSSSQS